MPTTVMQRSPGVSDSFFEFIRESTERMFNNYSPGVRRALIENNYQVCVAVRASDIIQTPRDFYSPEREQAWELDIVRAILNSENPPLDQAELRRQVEQEKIKSFKDIVHTWDHERQPQYLTGKRVVLVPEKYQIAPSKPGEPAGPLISTIIPNKDYAAVMRHETGHFFDFVVGKATRGKNFSEDPIFCNVLLEDIYHLRQQNRLPRFATAKEEAEFAYAFPIRQQNERRFQEAFTEIFSATQGGGYLLSPQMADTLFPRTVRYVKERLLANY